MKGKSKLKNIILAVGLLVFVISAIQIAVTCLQYREADETYEKIQEKYMDTVPEQPPETEGATIPAATETETVPTETLPIQVDFDTLLQDNGDVVGWIYSEGTPINYPVVQASDNSYYLRRDMNGNYLVSGTVFLDYRCGLPGEDRNYVIFGHNMKNETMFGTLVKYKDSSYYAAHPVLYYLTPDVGYKIELYAGLVVSTDEVIYRVDLSEEEMSAFLEKAKEKSTFTSETVIEENDNLVTLSTCSYEFDGARYVLIGKLVPIE